MQIILNDKIIKMLKFIYAFKILKLLYNYYYFNFNKIWEKEVIRSITLL